VTTFGPAATRGAFEQAATWFVRVTTAVGARWDEPGLGEWMVRDLVGHTSRALLTVEAYLQGEQGAPEVSSATEYFQRALASIGDPAAVARRGRDAGIALGDDPVEAVSDIAARVLALVDAAPDAALAATPAGVMRLLDYLPTRTFELTVHTCDLAVALGVAPQPPEQAALQSLTLVAELAVGAGWSAPLLLATTGRCGLPMGYTVL